MRFLAPLLFALLCLPAVASAAIAPEHYRSAQLTAPDVVTIDVIEVKTSICLFNACDSQEVTVKAKIKAVERTKSGLKIGQTITIVYTHRSLKGMSGPSPIRILSKGETTLAWLHLKTDTKGPRIWAPAARKASFSPLIQ